MELADPPHASGMPGTTYVYVPDVDASHAAALAAGASEVSAPEGKPYGERQSGVRDEYGNIWWIATFDHPASSSGRLRTQRRFVGQSARGGVNRRS